MGRAAKAIAQLESENAAKDREIVAQKQANAVLQAENDQLKAEKLDGEDTAALARIEARFPEPAAAAAGATETTATEATTTESAADVQS